MMLAVHKCFMLGSTLMLNKSCIIMHQFFDKHKMEIVLKSNIIEYGNGTIFGLENSSSKKPIKKPWEKPAGFLMGSKGTAPHCRYLFSQVKIAKAKQAYKLFTTYMRVVKKTIGKNLYLLMVLCFE